MIGLALWAWVSTAWPEPAMAVADPGAAMVTAVAEGVQDTPVSTAMRLLLLLTGLSFLPAMVVVMTPFARFAIVFSLLRQALGLQQSPPNQVIIGLSMFLTLMVMQPTMERAWETGMQPFLAGEVPVEQGMEASLKPFREFMFANTRKSDMFTILEVAQLERPDTLEEVPTSAVVSAFILSELKTSFLIAVYIFVPFLVIDLVVSSILLGMGMMMMPPTMISLPFKLMIFVLMDGWGLLVRSIVQGIHR